MKRFLKILTILSVVLLIVGCSSSSNAETAENQETENGANETESNETAAIKAPVSYTVNKTDISAYQTANYSGYGAIYANPQYGDDEMIAEGYHSVALVNKEGGFVKDFTDTFYDLYYFDGIVSLCSEDMYTGYYLSSDETDSSVYNPRYWHLDGTEIVLGNIVTAGYFKEGLVTAIVDFGSLSAVIMDTDGRIVETLPESYAEYMTGYGGFYQFQSSYASMFYQPSNGFSRYYEYDTSKFSLVTSGYRNIDSGADIDLTDKEYTAYGDFSEGLAAVRNKDSRDVGFINTQGELVIPFRFVRVSTFNEGYCACGDEMKMGYIDNKGNVVIPFEYDNCFGYGEGLFAVGNQSKCGMVNANNEIVVPLEYDYISAVSGGVAYAIKDGMLEILTFEY